MHARHLAAATFPVIVVLAGASWAGAQSPPDTATAAPAGSAAASAAPDSAPPPLPPAAAAPDSRPAEPSPPPAATPAPVVPVQPYGAIGWAAPQPAPTPAPLVADKPSGPTRDMSRDFWQVELGLRSSWIPAAGFDPFSTNNNLSQLSISGTRAFVLPGRFSVAAGLLYEVGSKEAQARGATARLTVYRAGAVGEGRFHVGRDVYTFVRLVPQAVYSNATLQDLSISNELQQHAWRFGVDGTVGGAWNVPRTLGARSSVPEAWLIGEFGYGWTLSRDTELTPDVSESDPNSKVLVNMGPLALNGIMMRVSAAMTF